MNRQLTESNNYEDIIVNIDYFITGKSSAAQATVVDNLLKVTKKTQKNSWKHQRLGPPTLEQRQRMADPLVELQAEEINAKTFDQETLFTMSPSNNKTLVKIVLMNKINRLMPVRL